MHAIAKGGQLVFARLMWDRYLFGPPILGHKISSVGRSEVKCCHRLAMPSSSIGSMVRCAVPRFGEGAVNEELGCGEIFAQTRPNVIVCVRRKEFNIPHTRFA